MNADNQIRNQIRERLMRFINRRERAYKEMIRQGKPVPEYQRKVQAITALRAQLQASAQWSLHSHVLWICAMREQVAALLPFEFHDDPRQIAYRKAIIDLLRYCDDQLNTSNKLFTTKLKAA